MPWRTAAGWWSGLWRGNLTNSVAAFVCAWMGVPMAILTGGIGAVLGGVAGAFSGSILQDPVLTRLDWLLQFAVPIPVGARPEIGHAVLLTINDLVPELGWQTGGILGGILGAICGGLILGWDGLVWPWALAWTSDATWPVSMLLGNVVAAVLVAAGYVAALAASERWVLGVVAGARAPTRAEAAVVGALLAQACVTRLGVFPSRPRILITDEDTPRMIAHVRHVVASTALVSAEHSRAVVITTHAAAVWRSGTPVARAWADGLALPVIVLYEIARRVLDATTRVRPVAFALRLVLWPLLVTGRLVLAPVRRAWWRRRVYAADAVVAGLGLGDELAAWLNTTPARPAAGTAWWSLTTVDPPRAHRLDRLTPPAAAAVPAVSAAEGVSA